MKNRRRPRQLSLKTLRAIRRAERQFRSSGVTQQTGLEPGPLDPVCLGYLSCLYGGHPRGKIHVPSILG